MPELNVANIGQIIAALNAAHGVGTITGMTTSIERAASEWVVRVDEGAAHGLVFVAAMSAGLVAAGGDPRALAGDADLLGQTVDAVREGFAALRARGVRVQPRSVQVLFGVLPRRFAIAYWRRALPGTIGTVTMAPHARSSRHDELPDLISTAQRLTGSSESGSLARLLAQLPVA